MLKTILAGIVAFALSMAIAVGAVTMLGGGDAVAAPAIAEPLPSDPGHAEGPMESRSETALMESAEVTGEPGDSARVAAIADSMHETLAATEDAPVTLAESADTTHADPAPAEAAAQALAALDGDTAAGVPTSAASPSGSPIVTVVLSEATPADSARQARLGRIFASMQPREAAKVLEQMDDRDVVRILGMLQERQAAAVLASLPPPRAAAISRSGLGPAEGRP